MSSVDGRLLPSRWTPPFDGENPGNLFIEYGRIGAERGTDAWMFGKSTTQEKFPQKFMSQSSNFAVAGTLHKALRKSARLFITVDPDADIRFTEDNLRGDDILTVLGSSATEEYLEYLRQIGISYLVVANPLDPKAVMDAVGDHFGVKSVSLQGGGIIDGAMLAAGLLDELSMVIYPCIDGLTASPSIFEYLGASDSRPAAGQSLELLTVERHPHGIVHLRYIFHHQ